MIFEIGPDEIGQRLDRFLTRAVPGMTRSQLQQLNHRGGIRVNEVPEKSGYRLRGGDRVELVPPDPVPFSPEAEAIPLRVQYEDEHLAVIEKPAGMVVHPGAGHRRSTLVNALLDRYPDLSSQGGPDRPGIVHRLDKLTSGLILIARTNAAHSQLADGFQKRQVRKRYVAGVHGVVADDEGRISLSIGRHRTVRTRMAAGTPRGRAALTAYRVRERADGFTLLDVDLHTGRTHQIRVHLGSIGHPVLGDPTYGGKPHAAFVRRYGDPGRYFLHASRLEFPHPVTGERLVIESGLPVELARLWEQLKDA
jgi:23S rRNA pseudouridine1911/1915/1917 synthase